MPVNKKCNIGYFPHSFGICSEKVNKCFYIRLRSSFVQSPLFSKRLKAGVWLPDQMSIFSERKAYIAGLTHSRINSFKFQKGAWRLIIRQGKYITTWIKYTCSLLFAAGHSWIACTRCSIVFCSVDVFKTLWKICECKWKQVVRCFFQSWAFKKFPSFKFRMLDNALLLLVTPLPPLLYNLINVSLQEKEGMV